MWPKVDPLPIPQRAPEKHFSSVPRGQPPNGTPVLPSQAELTAPRVGTAERRWEGHG